MPTRPVMPPVRVSVEPLAPVLATFQVWLAPRTSGALIVIAPALPSIVIPSAEEAGAIVRAAASGPPGATTTLVMPVGLEVNWRLPTVKLPSSVVTYAVADEFVVLKMTLFATPGKPNAFVVPAASVKKFVLKLA